MSAGTPEVVLDPDVIVFPNTYITSTSRFTFKIFNNMKRNLRFRWSKYASREEEQNHLSTIDLLDPESRQTYSSVLDFNSENFVPEQVSGEIWPNRFTYFTFNFVPHRVNGFEEHAYLLDVETGRRFCLTLKGVGLPPDARFDVDLINVGAVPLDSIREYEVTLSNKGAVTLVYDVESGERNGIIVNFKPSHGEVRVGDSRKIRIQFIAESVCSFNEIFLFNVKGASNFKPGIKLHGKVFGPEFAVSPRQMNFGDVAYGFLYAQEFDIENKSDIPFDFTVRVVQDNTFSPRELNIVPAEGTVKKYGKQPVRIEFVPISVQKYGIKLVIDILKVGKELSTVVLTANCLCPKLSLASNTIDFDRVFIGKQYSKEIVIVDESPFPAKFEFVLPPDSSVAQALVSVSKEKGVVQGSGRLPVRLSILPQVLGPIQMTGHVRAFGGDSPLIPFTMVALCTGPNILLSTQMVNFGTVRVLNDAQQNVIVKNDSLIPARFTSEIQSDTGVFSVEPDEGEIPPGESLSLTVTASIDDTISFSGKLAIFFQNLNPLYVDLVATGQGTPIVSSIPMNTIDFEYILNEQETVQTFTITNHGRRSQELRWSMQKPKVDEKAAESFKLTISPDQFVLAPRSSVDCQITAFSQIPCSFSVGLTCNATMNRTRMDLWKPTVTGMVIRPVLSFSTTSMEYVHRHDSEKEELIASKLSKPSFELMQGQTQTLTVKNLVQLPLDVSVDFAQPFLVSPARFTLSPSEKLDLSVQFNAAFKEDFCSEVINRRLTFSFEGHPQKLFVNVKGTFIFPNLSFSESNNLDFGNMMINTEETKTVKMTVSSDMDVEWSWQLLSDDPTCDICRIFDVFPIRGKMSRGESDEVHFSFFAVAGEDGGGKKYSATAICHVIGGPDYVINLSGASAAINYTLTPSEINFGARSYDTPVSQMMKLENLSRVPITYTAKVSKGSRFASFNVTPSEGTVNPNSCVGLHVHVIGGLPQDYTEYLVVKIGHYEELKIPVHMNCYFPQISTNLPRDIDDPAREAVGDDCSKCLEYEKDLLIDKVNARQVPMTSRRRRNEKERGFKGYVLSRYFLDTGSITVGDERSFEFEVVSHAPFPISFEIESDALKGTGFSIEPAAVEGMPPNSSVTVKVLFETSQRLIDEVGEMGWDILFKLTDALAFVVHLSTKIVLPMLNLSRKSFHFGEVIVGQKKVVTLQLQNMNMIPCQYCFNSPAFQKPGKHDEQELQCFSVSPSSGTLPAGSFQNVEISFTPTSGIEYAMNLPLNVRYNLNPKLISVTGTGVQMRVIFDPPIATLPPILPFSDPSEVEVKVINPTNYPVDLFSYHFDFDLFCDHFRKTKPVQETENVVVTQNQSVTKFSICVIVHGPKVSGCSTVAKMISEHLDGVPVISLKEIWKELLETEGSSAADFTGKFFDRISQPDCGDGFVVDSLDLFPDGKDVDQFIVSCLKTKNCYEETLQNPFKAIPHQNLMPPETALSYLLQALDGHYVFFVGVRTTLESVFRRIEQRKRDAKQKEQEEFQAEKHSLFSMTEEEYQALTDEQKEEIDNKRKQLRTQIVEECEGNERREGRNSRRSQHGRQRNKDDGKLELPKRKKNQSPSDPHDKSILLFELIAGSLAKSVEQSNDCFQVLDPDLFKKKLLPEEEEEPTERPEKPKKYVQQKNSILLESIITLDELKESIVEFVPTLQMIKEVAFTEFIPEPRVETSSVQPPPVTMYQTAPEYFSIVNFDSPRELPDFEEEQEQAESRNNSARRKKSPQVKKKEKSEPIEIDFDISRLTNRWRIEPNSSETITISFCVDQLGQYKTDLLFGLNKCVCDVLKLPCVGFCGQPNIERSIKTIFDKRVAKADWRTERAYATDTREFTFGPVLLTKEKLGKNQLPPYVEEIHLTNPTVFPAKVSMNFRESTCQWVVDPATVVIPAGETVNVKVGVNANVIGTHKAVLSVMVADQPEPFSLNFTCVCCSPSLELSTTNLDFGKLLLKQSRDMAIDFKNTGIVPVFWRLKGINGLEPNITFNAIEGNIAPKRGGSLRTVFTSEKAVAIKKPITLEILDKAKTRVYETHNIAVAAEAFDVTFDFQYPKGMDHLQFGNVKVSQKKTLTCALKNKGKFPAKYKITFDPKIFDVQPNEGSVGPTDKPHQINFTIHLSKVSKFTHSKGISMSISDKMSGTTTSVLPIPFSCDASYSQFSWVPGRVVDFGIVPITSLATQEVTIQNDGKFPFEFELWNPAGTDESVSLKTDRSKKGKAAPKPRAKKAGPQLQVGNFSLTPSSGTVQPGASQVIEVEFQCPNPGDYGALLAFKVTDQNPSERESEMCLRLKANSIAPGVVTTNYEKMFPGLSPCLRYSVTKQDRTAFLEDEQVLHFAPQILQRKDRVSFTITNPKPVPCVVDLSIKGKNGGPQPFELSEKSVSLDANSTHTIGITFSPTTCDSFVGVFEGAVRGGVGPDKLMKFTVEGVGTLPNVRILGLEQGKANSYVANLGKILIGFTKEKTITLVNDGVIDAQIKLTKKDVPDFTIVDDDKLREFIVPPGRKQDICLVFNPTASRRNQLDLTLAITDNPKATSQLQITAEGSSEDVLFQGLASDDGDLIFNNCVVGRQQQTTFVIKNVGSDVCKFAFSQQPNLTFTPRLGHLHPGKTKEITASFFSDHPIKQTVIKLNCQISKIKLTNPEAPNWDDSMKVVKFVEKDLIKVETPPPPLEKSPKRKPVASPKRALPPLPDPTPQKQEEETQEQPKPEFVRVVEVKEEPENTIIEGKTKDLPLKATVVVDNIRYSIDTKEISFSPTMMYQTRTVECKMTNTCQIRFEYHWRVDKFNSLRTGNNSTPPFVVEPSSGFIEPGAVKIFKIKFSPEEVDDFTGELRCEIPFLSQLPTPIISVSGLSRRPLCHISAELSDYLTRRYPEYTNPLPSGVKVIELFSTGAGRKTTHRIEILNPTSSAYEAVWTKVSGDAAITCETPSALVSSGKKCTVLFSYAPTTVKPIETLWEFQIPEFSMSVHFLLVGRIMPKS